MEIKKTKINRTTITLYKTMLELLESQSFDDITVNDICQSAMISRSTFYSYFNDKYELVIFTLQQERAALEIVKGKNIEQNLLKLLYRFKEKKCVYKNLLLAQTNRELSQMIMEHTGKFVRHAIEKTAVSEEALNLQTTFCTSGISGIVIWWLKNDFPITEEALTQYILDFTNIT
ncbi:TetR/AcrR family transcriptional regulator C-terminal domain-containing protein [Vagococcus acidifermentans]|uniref:HTH tetR-type domain-containing protein n=1 Tax=Vagococcus acidifermentans TaxID=564710 RepID=A0A430AS43_9ENTE|nr:TetR/AcrR family transcriptional regulator C-terminal domain-containing protein [Vagococcus acidifermentans]RSU10874.1 hypothetical protein CBF27_09270 [Vagococcus acidifermentans]